MFFYLWATLPEINILYPTSYILYITFTNHHEKFYTCMTDICNLMQT